MKPLDNHHRGRAKGNSPADLPFAVVIDRLVHLLPGTQRFEVIRQEVQVVCIRMEWGYATRPALVSVEAVVIIHGKGSHEVLSQDPLYAPRKGGLA